MVMLVRGIRGAITVVSDDKELVIAATARLLKKMQQENQFREGDIISVFLSATPDIKSVFPAEARRLLQWDMVPLMCFQEIDVAGALPLCIRAMVHINSDKEQDEIKHIYLEEARSLRKDLIESPAILP
ncbi:MAG: chorismate mutase [Syntrophomonadaceae bacterium]|jgi:chorismate mutase|nr:chorismate mutase [Syntrophomonadaceae bacterium]